MPSTTIGIVIMIISVFTGLVVMLSKGSLRLQKPEGALISWIYNLLNLFILILFTPLVSVFLIKEISAPLAFARISLSAGPSTDIITFCGLALYLAGTLFICWGRIALWGSFRLGAVRPRESDTLRVTGPFRIVRHPMYTGVILTNLGLTLALQSGAFLFLTVIMLFAIIVMIPSEEKQLLDAYGEAYKTYEKKVKKLFPWVY